MKTWDTNLDNMAYIIRNEGILPLTELCNKYGEGTVCIAQSNFVSGLYQLMHDTFNNAKITIIDAKEQIENTSKKLKDTKTISLDTFYKGTYNIEITRLFEIDNGVTKFVSLTNRQNTQSIQNQIENIKPGNYTLVDDDAVGGRTIREVIKMLPTGVRVDDIYLMMDAYRNKSSEPILDVVDCRDFLVGVQGCGLTVYLNDTGIVRLPYTYPFVDIGDKANIPDGMEYEVSHKIWQLNKEFWNTINPDATLFDTGRDFIKMAQRFGMSCTLDMQSAITIFSQLSKKGIML